MDPGTRRSTGAEPSGEVPLAVRTDTLAVIGAAEGGGPAVFGRVRDVAFDAEGRLLVLDDLSSRVVVFDTAGRHRSTVGRAGQVPGEFGQAIAVAAAGRRIVLHVFDPAVRPQDRRGVGRSGPGRCLRPGRPVHGDGGGSER